MISVRASFSAQPRTTDQANRTDTGSHQLPALSAHTPDHAMKPSREPDFHINTSALKRAFPDFSQYGSSEEDSIEVGRGVGRKSHENQLPSEDPSENISLDLGPGGRFQVTGTPPLKLRGKIGLAGNAMRNAASKRLTSEKENQDPMRNTDDVNGDTLGQRSDGDKLDRRNLQPVVESNDSFLINNRSQKASKPAAKNAHFSKNKSRQPLRESKTASNAPTQEAIDHDETFNSAMSASKGTYQSFMLPDMPNITELVSGVRQDGTPLFPRGTKSRSRPAVPSSVQKTRPGRSLHANVENVPIAADERALFLSIQLLQEKVKSLEKERAQSDKRAEDNELEMLQMRSKLEEQENMRASDSGLGFDAEEEKTKEWENEKSRFEVSIKSLQKRLDRANKKITESEEAMKDMKSDRDSAHQQLAIAYINSEELEKEDQGVRDGLGKIRAQLAKATKQHERKIEKLTRQEVELRQKMERREKAINEMGALAKELWNTRNAIAKRQKDTKTASNHKAISGTSRTISVDDVNGLVSRSEASSRSKSNGTTIRRRASSHSDADQEAVGVDQDSDAESTTRLDLSGFRSDQNPLKDPTYLSFMEGDEISKLRKVLEQDKVQLAKTPGGRTTQSATAHTNTDKTPLPRKSSLKDLSSRSKNHRVTYEDEDTADNLTKDSKHSITRPRSRSKTVRDDDPFSTELDLDRGLSKDDTNHQSLGGQKSQSRRRRTQEWSDNMTSALLLDDITICRDEIETGTLADINALPKAHTTVQRPVPVTSRAPPTDTSDPTVRPAQTPSVALATVIQTLQTELASLRERLSKQEALYREQDPSLGKRKRKTIHTRIQKLLRVIERRSDQIYGLYDVLEGQKAAGAEMEESEVDVTLDRFGLGEFLGLRGVIGKQGKGRQDKNGNAKAPSWTVGETDLTTEFEDDDDNADGDGDDERVWEGFGDTNTLESLRALQRLAA